jgi:hypothetical protein
MGQSNMSRDWDADETTGGPQDTLLCFLIMSDIIMAFAVLQLATNPEVFVVLYVAGACCTVVGTVAAYGLRTDPHGSASRRCSLCSYVMSAAAAIAAGVWVSSLYLVIACAALQLYAQGWLLLTYARTTAVQPPSAIRVVLSQSALYTLPSNASPV